MIGEIKKKIPIVILAAGEAKRLEPLSDEIIKPIVPIAGIPLINRIITNYYENGFNTFIVVISNQEKGIKSVIESMDIFIDKKITIDYAIQEIPKGMADAILRSENYIKKNETEFFFVTASDVIFEKDTPNLLIESHFKHKSQITLSLIYSEDPKMADGHGNVEIRESNVITKIIEKPGAENKISNYYSMPVYIFPVSIFDYIKQIGKSERGEYEVQTAIQKLIDSGRPCLGIDILPSLQKKLIYKKIGAYHITYPKDLLQMTFRLINQNDLKIDGGFPTTIEPAGSKDKVVVGDSVFIGPNVYIGKNCVLEDFVEISNSILFDNIEVGKSTTINNSIIGNNVKVEGEQKINEALILNSEKLSSKK